MVDAIANKIIQKYQNSTCDQLWQEKAEANNKPKSPEEQRAMRMARLRNIAAAVKFFPLYLLRRHVLKRADD